MEWLPLQLGVHTIDVRYGDGHVVGSPFRCKVFDLKRVRILRDDSMRGSFLGGQLGRDDVVFYGELLFAVQ